MATGHVQTAKTTISNQSNVTLTWSTAPTVGNLVIVGIVYDADRTLVLPSDETDGWTTRIAPATLGNDTGGRVVRIDTAIVGSGTDTSWFWDITPNDNLGVIAVEVSGVDVTGMLKTESVIDNGTPLDINIDGDTDPSAEMYYFLMLGTKNFGGSGILFVNSDTSMIDLTGAESGGGTNWAMNAWYEILDGARPTANLTSSNKSNTTGTALLLGVPVATSGTIHNEIGLSDIVVTLEATGANVTGPKEATATVALVATVGGITTQRTTQGAASSAMTVVLGGTTTQRKAFETASSALVVVVAATGQKGVLSRTASSALSIAVAATGQRIAQAIAIITSVVSLGGITTQRTVNKTGSSNIVVNLAATGVNVGGPLEGTATSALSVVLLAIGQRTAKTPGSLGIVVTLAVTGKNTSTSPASLTKFAATRASSNLGGPLGRGGAVQKAMADRRNHAIIRSIDRRLFPRGRRSR